MQLAELMSPVFEQEISNLYVSPKIQREPWLDVDEFQHALALNGRKPIESEEARLRFCTFFGIPTMTIKNRVWYGNDLSAAKVPGATWDATLNRFRFE